MTDSATAARPYPDRWPRASETPTVEAYHTAIRKLVAERLEQSGKSWEDAVQDPSLEFTREDFEKIEADLLATGYRFEMSATVSLKEQPDKYKAPQAAQASGKQETDDQGRLIVGDGDNVFQFREDVSGTARFVSDVEKVMDMLVNGVPDGTIAVIDDSGGTLTAPILGQFTGVVCLGGTVRSHLGILTREYGVPCLMNVKLDGLSDGDAITVEYSKKAADAYADAATATASRARVLKQS